MRLPLFSLLFVIQGIFAQEKNTEMPPLFEGCSLFALNMAQLQKAVDIIKILCCISSSIVTEKLRLVSERQN